MKNKLLITILSGVLLLNACGKNDTATAVVSSSPVTTANPSAVVAPALQNLPNFAALVKSVGNTVVNITVDVQNKTPDISQQFGIDPNDPFSELFKRFAPQQPQKTKSYGSGFILSSDGYILTNAHVVNNASKITVKTTDKQELDAKLIGLDTRTDIALLKVKGNNLEAVKIGDPNTLDVGEWVAAIGAPFGFDNSVTQGIVSAKGRNLPSDNYVPFIQTDVPINPGNSGGPLFNLRGEVVGINSQIYSRSGGYMGISFSIPIDIAIKISDQLKATGKVSHGQLGVQIQSVSQSLAKSFGLNRAYGALVASIIPGSGAEKSGVKVGDIILKADDKVIEDSGDLPILIGSRKPGDKVKLIVFRDGKQIELIATLNGAAKDGDDAAANKDDQSKQQSDNKTLKLDKFGLVLVNPDVNSDVKRGVVVVKSNGVAQLAGITNGDIILSVDNKPVNNISQVEKIIAGKKMVAFLILHNKQQMFVTLSVD